MKKTGILVFTTFALIFSIGLNFSYSTEKGISQPGLGLISNTDATNGTAGGSYSHRPLFTEYKEETTLPIVIIEYKEKKMKIIDLQTDCFSDKSLEIGSSKCNPPEISDDINLVKLGTLGQTIIGYKTDNTTYIDTPNAGRMRVDNSISISRSSNGGTNDYNAIAKEVWTDSKTGKVAGRR